MNIQQLEAKKTPDLLALYNSAATRLGKPKVARFADRKTAIRRTQRILEEAKVNPAPEKRAEKSEPKSAGARMSFNFKPKAKIKALRQGTKRAAIYDALKQGATFDEVQEVVVEFDKEHPPAAPRTPEKLRSFTYEAIRLLHLYCGYGLEQREDGKIFVIG